MKWFCISLIFIITNLKTEEPDFLTKQFPKVGKSSYEFIPKNWKIISEIEGDLNFDKKKDIALVIESPKKKRLLLILWNKGKYYEIYKAITGAIPNKIKNKDFFSGISIRVGQLFIEQEGGENLSWKKTQIYKYIKNEFYLISEKNTEINLKTSTIREREWDYVRSVLIIKTINYDGSLNSQKRVKLKKESLQKLGGASSS